MADVTVTIEISDVSYQSWLRTSYAGTALNLEKPLLVLAELGPDQEDAFYNILDEAAIAVLKVFSGRQGSIAGTPFTITDTEVSYTYFEREPVLKQAAAIKAELNKAIKEALFSYITSMWLSLKGMNDISVLIMQKYHEFLKDIDVSLYKLHD